MEVSVEKNKSKETDNVSSEESKMMSDAALTLASLKHAKLDMKEAATLHELKNKIMNKGKLFEKQETQESSCSQTQVQFIIASPRLPELPHHYGPPDIPPVARLHGLIGKCSKPFEKQLTKSDVTHGQGRLMIRKDDVDIAIRPMLNKEEAALVLNDGFEVITYDSKGTEYSMVLKSWAKGKYYVLTTGWNSFSSDHHLQEVSDFITVWVFRNVKTEKLCFAIISRRLPEETTPVTALTWKKANSIDMEKDKQN